MDDEQTLVNEGGYLYPAAYLAQHDRIPGLVGVDLTALVPDLEYEVDAESYPGGPTYGLLRELAAMGLRFKDEEEM